MPVGAFLFVPDGADEPLYAIVRAFVRGHSVKFFTLAGRRVKGKGNGGIIDIPYEEASRHGRFVPLVALFTGHDLRRSIPWVQRARPKTGRGAADTAFAAEIAASKNCHSPNGRSYQTASTVF